MTELRNFPGLGGCRSCRNQQQGQTASKDAAPWTADFLVPEDRANRFDDHGGVRAFLINRVAASGKARRHRAMVGSALALL